MMTNLRANGSGKAWSANFKQIVLFAALLSVLRIIWVLLSGYGLYTEEAQYWLWSQFPAAGYYSKPPLVAYFNLISTGIMGDTELGVRMTAILAGFFMPLIVYFFAWDLFHDESVAFSSAFLLMVMPYYHIISLIFTTDSLVIVFWLLAQLVFYRAIRDDRWVQWLAGGLFLGMAILSKYTAILFYPVLLVYLYFYDKKRIFSRKVVLSLTIPALMSVPLLVWIARNDWVSFRHVLRLSGVGVDGPSITDILSGVGEYLGGQILAMSPLLFLPFLYFWIRKGKGIAGGTKLAYLSLPLIIVWTLFLFFSFNRSEVNWLFFAYGSLPVVMAKIFKGNIRRKVVNILSGISFGIMVLFFNPWVLDSIGLGSVYPPKNDTCYRMAGWEELGEYVSGFSANDTSRSVIITDHYHIASQLAFYVPETVDIYCINVGRRMNQFDLWPGLEDIEEKGFQAVYVSRNSMPKQLKNAFKEVETKQAFEFVYRETMTLEYNVYRLSDFNGYIERDAKKIDFQ